MDFFDYQERARSNTKRLVFLFGLAVVLTVATVYLCIAGPLNLIYFALGEPASPASYRWWWARLAIRFGSDGFWNGELLGWVAGAVMTVVVLGSSYKWWQLSGGGAAVAGLLGGRPLDLNTGDPNERRLLNVVEEMAIAAGLPPPEVYVLEDEIGINAFAAGHNSSDAVVGVTFGALKLLRRDELQGVIAHEFSHILNGDMRLNMRLIGWLHGILGLVILGRVLTLVFLLRFGSDTEPARRRRQETGPVFHPGLLPAFVLGCICIVAGSFGAFFARLIKSAVSRQREYLADAAAVQFTRNPDGIAGALMQIGGVGRHAVIRAARAEEASHMYFGDGMGRRWFRSASTHPPLTKRIQRINPYFDGKYPVVSLDPVLREARVTAVYREHGTKQPLDFEKLASVIGPAAAAEEALYAKAARESGLSQPVSAAEIVPRKAGFSLAHLQYAARFLGTMPESLRSATCQPFSAVALVYGMVCSKDPDLRVRQLAEIADTAEPGMLAELSQLLPSLDTLDTGAFLPLADLCRRALRQLSAAQYETFRSNLQCLVEADRQIDLFEYMLERMIVRHLDPHFRQVKRPPVQYYTLKPLLPDCAILLSSLARVGHEGEEEALAAFRAGAAQLAIDLDLRFLPLAECDLPQIDAAINHAAQGSWQLRQQILNALACAAATDGQVERREAELVRAIADAFGLPLPPFLCAAEEAVA